MTTDMSSMEIDFKSAMIEKISQLLEENKDITKKEFLSSVGSFYTELMGDKKKKPSSRKKAVKEDAKEEGEEQKPKKGRKKAPVKKVDGEKKSLNAYQLFVKEQMPILTEREKNKGEDEEKLSRKELMTEISRLWKEHKEETKTSKKDEDAVPKKRGRKPISKKFF
jgi:hypothetical protein